MNSEQFQINSTSPSDTPSPSVAPSPAIPPFQPINPDIKSKALLKLITKFYPTMKKHNIKLYATNNLQNQNQLYLPILLLTLSSKLNNASVSLGDYINLVPNYTDLPNPTINNPQYNLPKVDYSFYIPFANSVPTSEEMFERMENNIASYLTSFYAKVKKYDGISQSTMSLIILLSVLIILVIIMIIVSASSGNGSGSTSPAKTSF